MSPRARIARFASCRSFMPSSPISGLFIAPVATACWSPCRRWKVLSSSCGLARETVALRLLPTVEICVARLIAHSATIPWTRISMLVPATWSSTPAKIAASSGSIAASSRTSSRPLQAHRPQPASGSESHPRAPKSDLETHRFNVNGNWEMLSNRRGTKWIPARLLLKHR